MQNYDNLDRKTFLKIRHEIPKDKLYDATINVYKLWGTTGFPVDALMVAKELRPKNYLKDMPPRFKYDDKIRVFRASDIPPKYIDEVREEFSWTIHTMVARHYAFGCRHIYCAEIDKKDIIGYTTHAHQIIQYNSVYDVEYMSPTMFKAFEELYKEYEEQDLNEEGIGSDFAEVFRRFSAPLKCFS